MNIHKHVSVNLEKYIKGHSKLLTLVISEKQKWRQSEEIIHFLVYLWIICYQKLGINYFKEVSCKILSSSEIGIFARGQIQKLLLLYVLILAEKKKKNSDRAKFFSIDSALNAHKTRLQLQLPWNLSSSQKEERQLCLCAQWSELETNEERGRELSMACCHLPGGKACWLP